MSCFSFFLVFEVLNSPFAGGIFRCIFRAMRAQVVRSSTHRSNLVYFLFVLSVRFIPVYTLLYGIQLFFKKLMRSSRSVPAQTWCFSIGHRAGDAQKVRFVLPLVIFL